MLSSSLRQFITVWTLAGGFAGISPVSANDLEDFLRNFHQDPVSAMNRRLLKRDLLGHTIPRVESLFSAADIRSGEYIAQRDTVRAHLWGHGNRAEPPRLGFTRRSSVVTEVDHVEDLFPGQELVRNISLLQGRGLIEGHAARDPWSETYWPMSRGLIAYRYADPAFGTRSDWLANFNYARFNPASKVLVRGDDEAVNRLSPAEKYDLLVGDVDWTLTRTLWDKGRSYYQVYGRVDSWMGICEGWAGASSMIEAPRRTVEMTSFEGRHIRFSPSDIRALASLLWSTGKFDVHLTGSRCRVRNPPRDSVGRLLSEDCFNTNPATWHVAMVNAVGVQKRSLVMDATYDFEVWNQPLYAYRYRYFNPQTLQHTDDLGQAIVPVEAFLIDKFKSHRNPQARSVVGITMDATYAIESDPSLRDGSSTVARVVNYVYDLELDADGNIVGGEWYTNEHPDFLWLAAPDAHAVSLTEGALPNPTGWDGQAPFPVDWQSFASTSSSFAQPLAAVVDRLVSRANATP